MTVISRRQAFSSLFGACALLPLFALSARADGPGDDVPGKGRRGRGLKAEFTPGDRETNRKCIDKTLTEAPTNKTWSWKNPRSGNGGTVTPTSPRQRAAGEVCRDFTETVTLKDGRAETVSGRACRRPDGSWNIVA